jgi:hypothetical protein
MTKGSKVSCRLRARPLQVLGSQGPLLTNRMSELLTYGSVGGVGRKPGPYPALDGDLPLRLTFLAPCPAAQSGRVGPRRMKVLLATDFTGNSEAFYPCHP